ncbi:MAG TPA: glutamate-5-semialdehyde dehydrogenase [Clostridiaceae bacterium]|nr:glutamate-5-semialdehyde dehydrogenase [Clostridiaceae bacterium]
MKINEISVRAKEASIKLAAVNTEKKNAALSKIAELLWNRREEIFKANQEDLERSREEKLSPPLLKRLKFDESKLKDVIDGIKSLILLEDPVGKTILATELDDGLELYRITCPIGVIGVIFESRPDALVQISTLCLKSGNSVLLKGGSEARETNRILAAIFEEASREAGMPDGWINLLETRSHVNEMLKMDQYIDLIIPRGSNEFVRYIMDNSRIPVLGHADGICHCYVDKYADLDMAVKVAVDSKTQYVAVCNALETLLVHEDIAPDFLPVLKEQLDKKNTIVYGCPKTREIIPVEEATEEDWKTEYLDYKLSVKVVKDIDEAINHINTYGSGHTDSILTNDRERADYFMDMVDSGNVFWNCSTRFSDGFRYGFGAEVGISTNKIHARGPVGLDGLVIYKYKLLGKGHIVEDYVNRTKTFKHRKINLV